MNNQINSIIAEYLNQEFIEIPIDFLIQLINILIALAKHDEIKLNVMNSKLVKSLYNAIKVLILNFNIKLPFFLFLHISLKEFFKICNVTS